jgi:hypothetical protein
MEKAIASARAKQEYVQAIDLRYRHAGRPERRQILDELCHVVGYRRKPLTPSSSRGIPAAP